ncbi:hypothetical protein BU26DRAFT_607943 [Trematosphaeria pertusa]|uniref:F-box domain-containing protein n=1 Tax=Trematosphaeria pertusa TaxID=390896 RepID=A0A6A6I5Y0_9PLEO|nr:uncharacterized protein BU26DRAFT_607943 [Trematosphaeria pertusa]KAF2245761.1 hypothetical protein BU26DRAFT_607943 [Trematosphaeria pertusa]
MENPPLLSLPIELLLRILDHYLSDLPRHRLQDLVRLSAACKRLRPIALELLLTQPVVHIYNVHGLVRMYFEYPVLATKARTVEVSTRFREGCRPAQPGSRGLYGVEAPVAFAPELDKPFKQKCIEVITAFNTAEANKERWTRDLDEDHQHAFLGILFAILPNLRGLFAGSAQLAYFPVFGKLFGPNYDLKEDPYVRANRVPYRHTDYLDDVFAELAPRLRYLELPFDRDNDDYGYAPPVSSFAACKALSNLSLSKEALVYMYETYDGSRTNASQPSNFFPASLETLAITIWANAGFLTRFLDLLANSKASFPKLRKINFYRNRARNEEDEEEYPGSHTGNEELEQQALAVKDVGLDVSIYSRPIAYFQEFLEARFGPSLAPTISEIRAYESRACYDGFSTLRDQADAEKRLRLQERRADIWHRREEIARARLVTGVPSMTTTLD